MIFWPRRSRPCRRWGPSYTLVHIYLCVWGLVSTRYGLICVPAFALSLSPTLRHRGARRKHPVCVRQQRIVKQPFGTQYRNSTSKSTKRGWSQKSYRKRVLSTLLVNAWVMESKAVPSVANTTEGCSKKTYWCSCRGWCTESNDIPVAASEPMTTQGYIIYIYILCPSHVTIQNEYISIWPDGLWYCSCCYWTMITALTRCFRLPGISQNMVTSS